MRIAISAPVQTLLKAFKNFLLAIETRKQAGLIQVDVAKCWEKLIRSFRNANSAKGTWILSIFSNSQGSTIKAFRSSAIKDEL